MVVVWEEAESKAASKVAIAQTTTIAIVEAITIVQSSIAEAAGHPGTEATAFGAATAETTGKAATVETATTKATVAAAKATAHATTSVAATTPASARQRHCWCSQTNGRNCQ
jgi:hypothetical protein